MPHRHVVRTTTSSDKKTRRFQGSWGAGPSAYAMRPLVCFDQPRHGRTNASYPGVSLQFPNFLLWAVGWPTKAYEDDGESSQIPSPILHPLISTSSFHPLTPFRVILRYPHLTMPSLSRSNQGFHFPDEQRYIENALESLSFPTEHDEDSEDYGCK